MLLHNYMNSDTYTFNPVSNNLRSISTQEIQSVKKRVEFYINHYNISIKKIGSASADKKLEFLTKIYSILENEINKRYTN